MKNIVNGNLRRCGYLIKRAIAFGERVRSLCYDSLEEFEEMGGIIREKGDIRWDIFMGRIPEHYGAFLDVVDEHIGLIISGYGVGADVLRAVGNSPLNREGHRDGIAA
ncbi:MAG: hypothetical protein ABIG28_03255 [archaeon]